MSCVHNFISMQIQYVYKYPNTNLSDQFFASLLELAQYAIDLLDR